MTIHRIARKAVRHVLSACIAVAALGGITATSTAAVFTYQGVLKSAGAPLNGAVDLKFRLYAAPVPPAFPLGNLAINGVVVTDGLFKVDLDFGPSAFNGSDRWLEIDVASPANSGIGPFTTLTPRQQIGFAPMAQFALNATLSGTYANAVTFSNAANAFSGSGAGLTGLNASNLASGTVGSSLLSGTYGNALTLNNAGNVFNGSGAGLTNINASNIGIGNLDVARLPQSGVWAIDNPLRIDNGTLAIDPAANRVGIGTTLPQYTLHVIGSMSVDLATLNVDDNLNRVGIGTSSPAARLHVVGTTFLDGVMTFDGPSTFTDVPEIPTTTRYVAIPAAGFRPSSEEPFVGTVIIYGLTAGSVFGCVAPVHVPHGATITNVNVTFFDNSNDEDLLVRLDRTNLENGGTDVLNSASSLFAVTNVRGVNVPVAHVVDNSAEALSIRIAWVVQSTPALIYVVGARVTYTIDEPLP